MQNLAELPACAGVLIAEDRGKAGGKAAKALAARLRAAGEPLVLRVAPPEDDWSDWNDVLCQADDPVAVWNEAVERAIEEEPEAESDPFEWMLRFAASAERIQEIEDAKFAFPGLIPQSHSTVFVGGSEIHAARACGISGRGASPKRVRGYIF